MFQAAGQMVLPGAKAPTWGVEGLGWLAAVLLYRALGRLAILGSRLFVIVAAG